ncbi:MAG: RHS repeat-associated core domain-containing protein, partial [Chloroflexi bacterium]|nr:RHS repeat-associated core domain-containing protein [Chloroflexota bacterium]
LTGKTDGTNTWTYTWDEDDRLTRVQGPGGVDVAYTYDSAGRMLTRVSGGVTTKFTWDGWDCIKEDDGTTVTRYYCPEGQIHAFERGSTYYQVHSDALGSVRAITDNTGAVVGSYSYGAWGDTLSASDPSGFSFPYRFVGALGVRFDSTTGLHWMRNRWFDQGLGRFISRDTLYSLNRYSYGLNNPFIYLDTNGLSVSIAPNVAKWCDQADPGHKQPGYIPFDQRWIKAVGIAKQRVKEMLALKQQQFARWFHPDLGVIKGYGSFPGTEVVYDNEEETGEGRPCVCQWSNDIDYTAALEGNWNVRFSPAPKHSEEWQDMEEGGYPFITHSQNEVYMSEVACINSAEQLAQKILHEITHSGLMKKFGRSDYWNSPGYRRRVGPLYNKTKGHPKVYFGTGIDCH